MFLNTQSGLISARHIVRIGGLNTRSTGNYHEIEYCVGSEPRETRATEDDVADFLTDAEGMNHE
jgi:hypothetical protein